MADPRPIIAIILVHQDFTLDGGGNDPLMTTLNSPRVRRESHFREAVHDSLREHRGRLFCRYDSSLLLSNEAERI
jgi:hypothetical protein